MKALFLACLVAVVAGDVDVVQQLERLKTLFDDGGLTEQEFTNAKQKVIGDEGGCQDTASIRRLLARNDRRLQAGNLAGVALHLKAEQAKLCMGPDADACLMRVDQNMLATTGQFKVTVNDAVTNLLPLRVEQEGSGDAGMYFKAEGGGVWALGIDVSDNMKLKIAANNAVDNDDHAHIVVMPGERGTGSAGYVGPSRFCKALVQMECSAFHSYGIDAHSCGVLCVLSTGVGTVSPAVRLDVNGAVKPGATTLACGAGVEGALRYNAGAKRLEVCAEADGAHGWHGLALQHVVDALASEVADIGAVEARYWRLKKGDVTQGHAPRVCQIRWKNKQGSVVSNIVTSTGPSLCTNNCNDQGWIWGMGSAGNEYIVDFGTPKKISSVELYTVYGASARGCMVHTYYSTESMSGPWTQAPGSPFDFYTDTGCGWYGSGSLF